MTKAEIVQEITNNTGIEKPKVKAIVEAIMEAIIQSVIDGNNIYLRGFGSFTLKKRAEKQGRNISTGTTIQIPAHVIPVFKPSDVFELQIKTIVKVK